MPRIDGFRVLENLRADPRYVHLPIVVYSSSEDADDKNRCMKIGADLYLSKSARGMDLHDTLERAISRRWAQLKNKTPVNRVN